MDLGGTKASERKGRPPAPPVVTKLTSRIDSRYQNRGALEINSPSASKLATGQTRKPVAALIVDWFYSIPPF